MDAELKTYLEEMESRMGRRMDALSDQFANLVAGEIGAMHVEMGKRFAEVDTKLTSIDSRLKLQAGLIQAGSRAMARYSAFSEDAEARWVDLATRVLALETKLGGGEAGA